SNPQSPAIAISARATASPPSEQSCTPSTRPPATSARTSSCTACAPAASARGGIPPSRPWTTAAHSDPPSSFSVSPSTKLRDGPGADAGDVACRLEHGEPAAGARVETAEPSLAVRGESEGAVGPLQAQDGGVGAGPGDGVEEQLVVVLAPHPRLVGDRRRGEQ